jgi:uncharacterized protein YjbI with pentapeptide repeats
MEEFINDMDRFIPGPESQRELEARGLGQDRVSLSAYRLRELFDHYRWLDSEGRFGKQLKVAQGFTAYRRDFVKHDLDGANFSRANFKNVMFVFCKLRQARFTGAELHNVDFLGCNLDGADFRGAELTDVSFEESNYSQAHFGEGVELTPGRGGLYKIFHHRPADSPRI